MMFGSYRRTLLGPMGDDLPVITATTNGSLWWLHSASLNGQPAKRNAAGAKGLSLSHPPRVNRQRYYVRLLATERYAAMSAHRPAAHLTKHRSPRSRNRSLDPSRRILDMQ